MFFAAAKGRIVKISTHVRLTGGSEVDIDRGRELCGSRLEYGAVALAEVEVEAMCGRSSLH